MTNLHLITGGQRSGKSRYAQMLALKKSKRPVYLATARIWDDDFKERVNRHKDDRGENWESIEIPVSISEAKIAGKVVLLDCITLWLTNFFFDFQKLTVDEILQMAITEFDKFILSEADLLVVTNEIGLGGHGENETARKFTDLQGWMNQYIASKANEVTLMVSGIPLKIK
ncbi:MAG: bifunctional adenosylcobinamide kinase/adenosylcobinamide-phosphate guanylyltransferase [Bacteroidales bacterium]|nr:bifunctional adenosylcobinamide kinase/adenosylcobinamide-phosphate guanylyltransferase [Bacteroidales bacterium]